MAPKNSKEKLLIAKIIASTVKLLEKWNSLVSEGKPLIQDIVASEKSDEFSFHLQEKCNKLSEILPQFELIIKEISVSKDKLSSAHDLSNLSLDSSSLESSSNSDLSHFEVILAKLEVQFQLMKDVTEKIGFEKSSEKSIFLACSWTLQPYLDDEYFLSLEYLKNNGEIRL